MSISKIVSLQHPPESWVALVNDGVDKFNIADTGLSEHYPVHLFIKDTYGTCLGGLLGLIWGGWLHVTSLWITEDSRGKGHGTRLLRDAERYALEKGCFGATLDTHSAEAKRLYEKLGYEVIGKIDDFPPGRAKFFLKKILSRQP
jgi:ribosomal protein S18 acetylase RimI-like enzyme